VRSFKENGYVVIAEKLFDTLPNKKSFENSLLQPNFDKVSAKMSDK